MTTEVTTPAATPAPAPQTVDIKAIASEAARAAQEAMAPMIEKQASKAAADKLAIIGKALSGESDKPAVDPVLRSFIENPAGTLHSLKEITKREVQAEQSEKTAADKKIYNAVSPFVNEYPELNTDKKLKAVERFAQDNVAAGMTVEQAYKTACEDAVKEFNLKSVSEAQRNNAAGRVGLPHGGGVGSNAPQFDEGKSSTDFIAGMKSRMTSFRTRK